MNRASPGPEAHLRHTYALVGALDPATPSTSPNRRTGRPSPLVARRARPSSVARLRLWPWRSGVRVPSVTPS